MYAVSNTTKKQLEKVLRYFAGEAGSGTHDVNMRRVAGLLAKKLRKSKETDKR